MDFQTLDRSARPSWISYPINLDNGQHVAVVRSESINFYFVEATCDRAMDCIPCCSNEVMAIWYCMVQVVPPYGQIRGHPITSSCRETTTWSPIAIVLELPGPQAQRTRERIFSRFRMMGISSYLLLAE